jgi:hypothetical protein
MKKLMRKLAILGLLLGGLAATNGDLVTKAYAVTCDDCLSRYDTCMAACVDYQSACPIHCQGSYNLCSRNCTN